MAKKLKRSLGLISAINISIGTMIGSAIFVLAGTSYNIAGPSASLAVFLSGVAAAFTALSFAELVTIIPTAGGGYAFVREAIPNTFIGFLAGWGFWLGYAMSCALFAIGFGDFLNYLLPPVSPFIGAYGLIIYITYKNLQGVGSTGQIQNYITGALLGILGLYIFYGFIGSPYIPQRPFFPFGMAGTLRATGLLYVTYIGYGLVTTVSEEVIEPTKTIPRAIFISLAAVTLLKTAVFFLGTSILPYTELGPSQTFTPLLDTAVRLAGTLGGVLFAVAGLLATISSLNTALLAASRTAFALGRDGQLPFIFRLLNPRTKIPLYSLLSSSLIIVFTMQLGSLENISAITSIMALLGYSLVNMAVIFLRREQPEADREFRVPLYPYIPALGIAINLLLSFQLLFSSLTILLISIGIMVVGLLYYFVLKPRLKTMPLGVTPQPIPTLSAGQLEPDDKGDGFRILAAVAGEPEKNRGLLRLALDLAAPQKGKVIGLHVFTIPDMISLRSGYQIYKSAISDLTEKLSQTAETIRSRGSRARFHPLVLVGRKRVRSLSSAAETTGAELLLLNGSTPLSRSSRRTLHRAVARAQTTVGIFIDRSFTGAERILFPYGGGLHSRKAASFARMAAEAYDAELTLLRVLPLDIAENELEEISGVMEENAQKMEVRTQIRLTKSRSIAKTIIDGSQNHDLLIISASFGWGLKHALMGYMSDRVMEYASCSVLAIRRYHPLFQVESLRRLSERFRTNT